MIRGIGTDIVDIDRIDGLIQRYGDTFLRKVFTAKEISYCSSMARPAIHFAGRFAVKEAFYKSLPTDLQSHSMWKSIQTLSAEHGGRPRIDIVDEKLSALLSSGGFEIHVSISHEKHVCVAMVVLEQA